MKIFYRLASRVNALLAKFRVQVISVSWLETLIESKSHSNALQALAVLDPSLKILLRESTSQRGQDLVAYHLTRIDRSTGYFVEVGAADGVSNSNTWALEQIGWQGLLIEPSREWHESLQGRRAATLETRAAYSKGGLDLDFLEDGELSGINGHFKNDGYNRKGSVYQVRTVTTTECLEENSAPKYIDFLSIDTEGSELEVLKGLDFEKYSFGFICVEHNYTAAEAKIEEFLLPKGYSRILETISMNDAYYLPTSSLGPR